MPVNSSIFNRFLWILLTCLTVPIAAQSQLPRLSDSELSALGKQIFANECASRLPCLTSWNAGEDFPSLGIGHFIWYRSGQQEPFEETFPALLHYMQAQGQDLPAWLQGTLTADSPWQTREQFLADQHSPKMGQLRRLLAETQSLQTRFIAERLFTSLPEIVSIAPPEQRETIEQHLHGLAHSSPPYGLYALIDYVHFKGTGMHPGERYQGQGWGLLQVLQAMPAGQSAIEDFVEAARQVLTRRTENAPPARNEGRWLRGWNNRLQTYLPSSGTLQPR